jgi:3-methyladenine DNA glycosylase AlkD
VDNSEVMQWLERQGTRRTVEEMARYGIEAERANGVPMGTLLSMSKRLGKDHALSLALWESGWYEARLLAASSPQPRRGRAKRSGRTGSA